MRDLHGGRLLKKAYRLVLYVLIVVFVASAVDALGPVLDARQAVVFVILAVAVTRARLTVRVLVARRYKTVSSVGVAAEERKISSTGIFLAVALVVGPDLFVVAR